MGVRRGSQKRKREDPHPGGSEQCAQLTMWMASRPNNPSSLLPSFLLHLDFPAIDLVWEQSRSCLHCIHYLHVFSLSLCLQYVFLQGKIRTQVSTADMRVYAPTNVDVYAYWLRLTSDIHYQMPAFLQSIHTTTLDNTCSSRSGEVEKKKSRVFLGRGGIFRDRWQPQHSTDLQYSIIV